MLNQFIIGRVKLIQVCRFAVTGLAIGVGSAAALAQHDDPTQKPAATANPESAPKPAAATPGAGDVSLAPIFKVDQEGGFTQHMVRSEAMIIANMAEQNTTCDITIGWTTKVTATGKDGTAIELTLKSIKADMTQSTKQGKAEMPGEKASWDSSKPDENKDMRNQALVAFRPLVGSVFDIKLDKDNKLVSASSKTPITPGRTQLGSFIEQITGQEWMEARWGQLLAPKTGDATASAGKSWQSEESLNSPPVGTVAIKLTHTLTGVREGMATIETKGAMELQPLKEGAKANGEIKDPAMTSTTLWDTKLGVLKSDDFKQKWTLDVNAQGLKVQRLVDLTITTTRN